MVPASFSAQRPAPRPQRRRARESAVPRRSSSSTHSPWTGRFRRTADACPGSNRSRRPPYRHRPAPEGGRSRSRDGLPGRRPPTILLARSEVASIEGVRIGGRRETRVLTDGPRLIDIHRRVRTADEWWFAREGVDGVARRCHGIAVSADENRFDRDAFRSVPVQLFGCVAVRRRGGRNTPGDIGLRRRDGLPVAAQWNVGETGHRSGSARGHLDHAPSRVSSDESASTASIFIVR